MTSIGIIGMGWVGSSVAISLLQKGVAQELLLNDSREGLAEGEAMDFNHGSSFFPAANVKATSIKDMLSCNAIVITAGRGGKPGESRLDLLNENVKIAESISSELVGYKGILIIVSNPVDVLTYFYQKFTKIPVGRVIGTGTMLDSARLKEMVGKEMNLDPRSIHAAVIGEHGDSEVVLWSKVLIGGEPIREWLAWDPKKEDIIAERVRIAAQEIIKRKGATNHAIGLVTATLLRWILRGERRIITVSTVLQNQFGLSNVAISLPSIVSEKGVEKVIETSMSDEEKSKFLHSAKVLKSAIKQIENS